MAPIAARRTEEEEDMLEGEAEAEEVEVAQPTAPAVSDSRRRRQMKRGEVPEVEPEPEVSVPVRKDRPTPSQREEPTKSRNFVIRFFQSMNTYRKETKVELDKVAWPTRDETTRLTYIVVAVTVVSSLFLGAISFLFSLVVTQIASTTGGTLAGLLAVATVIVVAGLWLLRDRIWRPKSE